MTRYISLLATLLLFACSNNDTGVEISPCACYDDIKVYGNSSPIYELCSDSMRKAAFNEEYARCQYKDITGNDYGGETAKSDTKKKLEIGAPADGIYDIDVLKSTVVWQGEKITGDKKSGRITIRTGSVEIKDGAVSSAEFLMDMNSIVVDEPSDPEKAKDLRDHLKNEDFFHTLKYPIARFSLQSIEDNSRDEFTAHGLMTLKEITHEEKAKLMVASKDDRMVIVGTMSFDRSKYGVNYRSASILSDLGDKAINDEIKLTISLFSKPM
jgi:polyisoprenoid-binding protein YceI